MKKFLSILSLSAFILLAVNGSIINVNAMPPRNSRATCGSSYSRSSGSGYYVSCYKYITDNDVLGNAVTIRNSDNGGIIDLSKTERTIVNQIIHNDEKNSYTNIPNPYYGPEDKIGEAQKAINKILTSHRTDMETLKKIYISSQR